MKNTMRFLLAILFCFVLLNVVRAQTSPPKQPAAQAGKTFTLSGETLNGYQFVQRSLTEAAEKMPEEHYGFRPTPDVRPFHQLVAHAAFMQFNLCSMLKDEPNPRKDEKEDMSRTKAEALTLLKASTTYCDPLVTPLTDAAMAELAKAHENQVAKGLLPVSLISHGMEMYGTMAVYLRLKGIVPPTTERQKQMKKSE